LEEVLHQVILSWGNFHAVISLISAAIDVGGTKERSNAQLSQIVDLKKLHKLIGGFFYLNQFICWHCLSECSLSVIHGYGPPSAEHFLFHEVFLERHLGGFAHITNSPSLGILMLDLCMHLPVCPIDRPEFLLLK